MKKVRESEPIGLLLTDLGEGVRPRYRLSRGDSVLYETSVLDAAVVEYEDQYDKLWAERPEASPKERRRRERAHGEMQAVRSAAFERRAAAARPKGGRGGRGGV